MPATTVLEEIEAERREQQQRGEQSMHGHQHSDDDDPADERSSGPPRGPPLPPQAAMRYWPDQPLIVGLTGSRRIADLPDRTFEGLRPNEAVAIKRLDEASPQLHRWRLHAAQMGLVALEAALAEWGVTEYDHYGEFDDGNNWHDTRYYRIKVGDDPDYDIASADAMRRAVEAGTDPNDYTGNTRYSCDPPIFRLLDALAEADPEVRQRNFGGPGLILVGRPGLPSHEAALEMLQVLLELGADPDRHLTSHYCGDALPIDKTDPTPLMRLATRRSSEISANELKAGKMLLDAGADPHVYLRGGSPFLCAVENGHLALAAAMYSAHPWRPDIHTRFPRPTRLRIRTVLLASRRPGCLLHKLDKDCLDKILVHVAAEVVVAAG